MMTTHILQVREWKHGEGQVISSMSQSQYVLQLGFRLSRL